MTFKEKFPLECLGVGGGCCSYCFPEMSIWIEVTVDQHILYISK